MIGYRGGGGGATAIERWTPCSFKKTRKKGRFSRTGDVRAYTRGEMLKIYSKVSKTDVFLFAMGNSAKS